MSVSQYKCPNCSAEIVFNPDTQMLKCDFCRSEFTLSQYKEITASVSESPEDAAKADEFENGTNLYHCESCGADIMADTNTTATFCYYCHNPVILAGKLKGDYRPSKVIGFRVNRETALESFRKWCGTKKFIPADFKSSQQLEKMTGLYVPFWVANCEMTASCDAMATKNVRSWTEGNYRCVETAEYNLIRNAKVKIDGLPADGESKIDDLLMESIEPFDYNDMKPFDMSYLSGFFADKYDVDRAGVFPRIRERATTAGKNVINESIKGYSTVKKNSEYYNIDRTNWEYAMLPVWFMTYRYEDKIYEFAINGQTGKLAGTPPLDKGRLLRSALLIGSIVAAIVYAGGQLLS